MAFVFRSERNLNDSRQKSKSKDKIIENSKNLSLNLFRNDSISTNLNGLKLFSGNLLIHLD